MHFGVRRRFLLHLKLRWQIILIFSSTTTTLFFSPSVSDPRISQVGFFCGTSMPPLGNTSSVTIVPAFTQEMEVLSQIISTNNLATHEPTPNSTIPMYSLAQCYDDLSRTDCLLCFAAGRTVLPRCLPALSGRIFLDGCFLRYDDHGFFNQSVDPTTDTANCTTDLGDFSAGKKGEGALLEFGDSVGWLIGNVTESAVGSGGFGVMEINGVFGLAQCWKSLSRDGCRECLQKAGEEVRGCLPSREGRGLNAGCYLRYSTQKFYDDGDQSNKQNSGVSRKWVALAVALSTAIFLILLASATYAAYARLSKLKEERGTRGQISNSFNKARLYYKYETLEKATDYFDDSRKIGQGGAGSVYIGTLASGETVAVKRLFFNTRQWVDEFFNEVNLISGIQHKNLVKLLGCSIEGPESLLVYEYLPNKSLNQFLFGNDKVNLSWKQRFEIIVGTAEGLAYLHGGTHVRIIHRDIKSSNILLDENLNPKIADFGLARSFGADKSHLSTGIAGTLGYMAPEYIVRGQLTEKADVYSYGVLVIEIVCGRKNSVFAEDTSSLLQMVWNLYNSNSLSESADPSLRSNFPVRELANVLQIGLLCTQASASLRPSMTEVVQMLTAQDREIPAPNRPPFLNTRALNQGDSGRSSNSVVYSASTKRGGFHSTTGSSSGPSSDEPSRRAGLDNLV